MMPLVYDNRVGFIDKPLMGYYVQIDSDSQKGGIEAAIKRTYQYEEIRIEVVNRINMTEEERKKYIGVIRHLYDEVRVQYAMLCCNTELFEKSADNLHWKPWKRKLVWLLGTSKICNKVSLIYKVFEVFARKYRNLKCNIRYIKLNSKSYLWY